MPERAQHFTQEESVAEYSTSDLEQVMERSKASSWREALEWIEGGRFGGLDAGAMGHMKNDLACLMKSGEPFVADAQRAYELAQEY